MRDIPAELAADFAAEVSTLARIWTITRADGLTLWLTDAVKEIEYDGDTYEADTSFTSSAVLASADIASAQNVEITTIMSDAGITERDIRARKWEGATARLAIINYAAPDHGIMILYEGTFGLIECSDKRRVSIDLTPKSSSSGRTITSEAYSPNCRNLLGDVNCKVNLEALKVEFTVTAATGSTFQADELDQADEAWTLGTVRWLTGDNAGSTPQVRTSDQSDKSVSLIAAPLFPIVAGDTGEIFPGCTKQPTFCRDVYDNIINFRGEPYVPQSELLTFQVGAARRVQGNS